ncbi:MAG: hypothetical protein D6690_15235, partial [Nitrospirae bacterium]
QRLAKALSRNVVSEAFQGIALLTEGRVTVGEIKKAQLVGCRHGAFLLERIDARISRGCQ